MRTEVPGAARSISSIAWKCDRFGWAIPTACTTPKAPLSQNGCNDAMAGCIPNVESSWYSPGWFTGMPTFGRHSG